MGGSGKSSPLEISQCCEGKFGYEFASRMCFGGGSMLLKKKLAKRTNIMKR
jgi:hypothetical protein